MKTDELDALRAVNPVSNDDRRRHSEPDAIRLRDAIVQTLPEAPAPRPRRRVTGRVLVLAACVMTAVIALGLVVGDQGGNQTANAAILQRVSQQLEPPAAGGIFHIRWELREGPAAAPLIQEVWQDIAGPARSRRLVEARNGYPVHEVLLDGSSVTLYDPSTRTATRWPSDYAADSIDDPLEQMRQAIMRGSAHVDGTALVDGIECDRIRMYDSATADRDDPHTVLYVDRETGVRSPASRPRTMDCATAT